jgi:hypothetical protein
LRPNADTIPASYRAAYVREATRFKSTRDAVNDPSRNEAVLQQAQQQAIHIGMPVTIARAAMEAILDSSVAFEECIVSWLWCFVIQSLLLLVNLIFAIV